jgi:molybdate transport system substrate-binding protein
MPTSPLRRASILILALASWVSSLSCSKPAPAEAAPLKVAAAADLALAFKDVGAAFEQRTGRKVTFTFGSTGQLAKQIAEGAPFDVFAAANISFVDDVVKAGACDGATKSPYARGRIVAWVKDGTVAAPEQLSDLTDARFVKVAIANPEHAPYGRAAQQALTSAGIWDTVKPKLVYGENIQQTFQFARSGNAEVAIVALSLAVATPGGTAMIIEESEHAPLDQALVVCHRGADLKTGAEFAEFVNSSDGRAIMKRFGFLLPGETLSKAP